MTIYQTLRLFFPGGLEKRRYLRELERSQWLSLAELEVLQFAKIQRLIKHAYEHVPYYRDLYQRLDIHPEDIKSKKDFQALPFLTNESINNHLDALVSPEFRDKVWLSETGGSTGEPMRFYIDNPHWWWNAVLQDRGRSWYGVQEGTKMAWLWGNQQDMANWSKQTRLKAMIKQQRYLNAYSMTETKMQTFAEMLVRWQPVIIKGYSQALSLFAGYIKQHRITGIRPKLVEATAEKLLESQRELLEEVFGCAVVDVYSAREFGTIAYQCPVGRLHVSETHYLEIIANGQVAQPGQLGEVTVTFLPQFAMPLIRYKLRDMAVWETGSCSCGRSMPVLREVVGRTTDYIVTVNGQFVHGGFFSHTFMSKREVARYQVFQPDQTHVEVRLICTQKVDAAWLDSISNALKNRLGPNMQISLKLVDNIELTPAGKYRFVISKVKPDFM